jgi:O-antigen/teichoic acid export membrane protein
LMILTVGQFVNAAAGSVGNILNMTNNQNVLQNTALISTITNIFFNFILIPILGIKGAAISTAISGILWNMLCVIYLKYKYDLVTIYYPKVQRGK